VSAKPHVLLIDDDASILSAVCRLLVRAGHEVTAAPNGAEALRLWREQGAGLVLTDLQMPGMNGLEVILQLRAYAPSLPVIAMSGGERSRDLDLLGSAGLLGAVGLLTKPFTADELAAAIAAAAAEPSRIPRSRSAG
jgi:CheY-like chemotaxis protein